MSFKGHRLRGAVRYDSSSRAVVMGSYHGMDCRRESGSGQIAAVAPDPTLTTTGKTRDCTKQINMHATAAPFWDKPQTDFPGMASGG